MYCPVDSIKTQDIGLYCLLTNTYCLCSPFLSKPVKRFLKSHFKERDQNLLATSLGGTQLIGRLAIGTLMAYPLIGNSRGLVLSQICTDEEESYIRGSLPQEIQISKISESIALGNAIVCNDRIALVSEGMSLSMESVEMI